MTDFEKEQFERQKKLAMDSFYEVYNPQKLRRQNKSQSVQNQSAESSYVKGISEQIINGLFNVERGGDVSLVASIIMLLLQAGADKKVILALIYIIL
ncbi:MAG: hypothetical protein KBS41_00700 [Oscillospiraceae bacterium]|nr:hypothetical protein [Candidatus Equicaccousia limihippi]